MSKLSGSLVSDYIPTDLYCTVGEFSRVYGIPSGTVRQFLLRYPENRFAVHFLDSWFVRVLFADEFAFQFRSFRNSHCFLSDSDL